MAEKKPTEQASKANDLTQAQRSPVLELRSVTTAANIPNRMREVNLTVEPGDLVVIERPSGMARYPLVPSVVGMESPSKGNVLFESNDWNEISYRKRLYLRTKIGRIHDYAGWIQNLTLFDNILLAARHHSRTSEKKLFETMHSIAAGFGLKLVNQRPAFVPAWKLRLSQWIRALMLKPTFLVAERPLDGVPGHFHDAVLENEAKFRSAGGATLWLTESARVIQHAKEIKARIYQIVGDRLLPLSGEQS